MGICFFLWAGFWPSSLALPSSWTSTLLLLLYRSDGYKNNLWTICRKSVIKDMALYNNKKIRKYISNLPIINCMGLKPNGWMWDGGFCISVCFWGTSIRWWGELSNSLVNGHIVRQDVITNDKLEFMTWRALVDRYCSLCE